MTRPYDEKAPSHPYVEKLKWRMLLFLPILFATLFFLGIRERYFPDRPSESPAPHMSSMTSAQGE